MIHKPKLLLHACCGTCSCLIPSLLSEEFDVTIHYVNPNIHPAGEYLQRLSDAKKVAALQEVEFIEADYDTSAWFAHVEGYAEEPEGGKRCGLCFEFRLRRSAMYAKVHGYDAFTTTLTIGRNKRADVINPIGERLAEEYGIPFLSRDFKKNGLLDRSVLKMDELEIPRQTYCGCVYSKQESERRRAARRAEHTAGKTPV